MSHSPLEEEQNPKSLAHSFGDLYMSLADYSTFEQIDFDYSLYLDILFREHIYVEESVFFLKDSPFLEAALSNRGHIAEAIRAGVIIPLTKYQPADSFRALANEYPHVKAPLKHSPPKTMRADMADVAIELDRLYVTRHRKPRIEYLTKDECRQYNRDLTTIFGQSTPPVSQDVAGYDQLNALWMRTKKYREDWVKEIVDDAEAKDFASAPKTDFNKRGAKVLGIAEDKYESLRQIIKHAAINPVEGPPVVAFLRWVHEIFYYSRATPLGSATTYANFPTHFNLPALYGMFKASIPVKEERQFEQKVSLPTLDALKAMSWPRLNSVRKGVAGEELVIALRNWQETGNEDDTKNLHGAVTRYAAGICEAAATKHSPLQESILKVTSNPLATVGGIAGVAGAASFYPPLAGIKDAVGDAKTMVGAVAGSFGLVTILPQPNPTQVVSVRYGGGQTIYGGVQGEEPLGTHSW